MKITLGQPVHTSDGPFGELADIVVHPATNTVSHIVVEPHHRHYQARLVPMSLIEVGDDQLTVQLDETQLRSLQCVAESDFVPIDQPIDLGDNWDVGIEHIVIPYGSYGFDMMGVGSGPVWPDHTTVSYDRIPKGDCEIRHESAVMSSDDHHVGMVAAMVIDGDHIEGVYIEAGLPGFRHLVAVPIMAVGKVRNDEITLNIDRKKFRSLPPVDTSTDAGSGKLAAIEHRVASACKRLAGAVRNKFRRD